MKKYDHLFAFGCSFTEYNWVMWPELLQYEFKCSLHNFGKSGASNFYIAHKVLEVCRTYNVNEHDLILICWTSIYRQEKYQYPKWILTGGLDANPVFDKDSLVYKHDKEFYQMNNYAVIKSINDFLTYSRLNYNMFSIQDITKYYSFLNTAILSSELSNHLVDLYQPVLDNILPDYHAVLNDNNLVNKDRYNIKQHKSLRDYHPLPLEHITYFEKVFDYKFSDRTKQATYDVQANLIKTFDDIATKRSARPYEPVELHVMTESEKTRLYLSSQYHDHTN